MTHYLIVRCRDKDSVLDIMEVIQREFDARGVCPVSIGDAEDIYNATSNIADNWAELKMLIIDPERDEEE